MLAPLALQLALHVPTGSSFPARSELDVLFTAGVCTIISDDTPPAACPIPVIAAAAATSTNMDEVIMPDGKQLFWLRGGDRASLLQLAQTVPSRTGFITSLPSGGAASVTALQRSCIFSWQVQAMRRCRAVVLPWPELQAAAAADEGGWDGIAMQLTRMRDSEWTTIQGG